MKLASKLKKGFSKVFSRRGSIDSMNMCVNDFICCGLVKIVKSEEEWEPPTTMPVPLVSVEVNAAIVHAVAQVNVSQVYENKEKQPIETIYYFPVNPDGAVTHFQAELDGRIIKGTVKPEEEAKEAYLKAVKNKTTVFLGEEIKADIFKVRVGFLKPGVKVRVVIGYVTEVKNEPGSNAIRFYIPTTIAPRYVSSSEIDDEKAKDLQNIKFYPFSSAPLSMKVLLSLQGKIKSIESPTHEVTIEKTGYKGPPDDPTWENAVVELAGETTDMDRDFVLNIFPEQVHKPRLYSEKSENGSTAMMLHLIPSFKLDEQKTELIFVLDRSGSMSGESIELAKKALLLFLHSMPADCYFNIVGFGSTFQFLFPNSIKYDDKSLKDAVTHAKRLQADLGETEILNPLQEIYGRPGVHGYLRQIFILTDGEVSNTDRVIGIAQTNAHNTRVFAIGIGEGASHYLVEGIATAGGGTSAFVTYNESFDKKVLTQLKNGLQPSLTDIELEWEGVQDAVPLTEKTEKTKEQDSPIMINKEKTFLGYNYTKPTVQETTDTGSSNGGGEEIMDKYKQSPSRVPPVYDGSQLLVFGLFKNEIPNAVTIKAESPDGPLTLRIEHSPEDKVGSGMLHRLAAVKLVHELEVQVAGIRFQEGLSDHSTHEQRLKKQIISIACENGITSKYTSYVIVDARGADKQLNDNWVTMQSRHVPTQLTHGWGGGIRRGSAQPRVFRRLASSKGYAPKKGGLEQESPWRPSGCSFDDSEAWTPSKSRPGGRMTCAALQEDAISPKDLEGSIGESGSVERSNINLKTDEDDEEHLFSSTAPPLEKLINLQSFDGSYTLDNKLCGIFGKSLQILKQETSKLNVEDSVVATALAIAYFSSKLAAEKDIWELVVIKARKWLAKQISEDQIDPVTKTAEDCLIL